MACLLVLRVLWSVGLSIYLVYYCRPRPAVVGLILIVLCSSSWAIVIQVFHCGPWSSDAVWSRGSLVSTVVWCGQVGPRKTAVFRCGPPWPCSVVVKPQCQDIAKHHSNQSGLPSSQSPPLLH